MTKVAKAEAVSVIEHMRAAGVSVRLICQAVGLRRAQVYHYIQTFGIKKNTGQKCPHCGVELSVKPLSNLSQS